MLSRYEHLLLLQRAQAQAQASTLPATPSPEDQYPALVSGGTRHTSDVHIYIHTGKIPTHVEIKSIKGFKNWQDCKLEGQQVS